jgi:sporulation protein YlmC with PRC-barrel domain
VVDTVGRVVGKVDGLLIDNQEAKVRFLEVVSGGFLGLGKDTMLIPVDAIAKIEGDHVHLGQTSEHVAGAPAYDPDLIDADYFRNLYGYYGVTPFWGMGYVYPAYPYYGVP